jgi:hypothetical protein
MLIIAVAALLLLGGVSTAVSRVRDQDPGPAIVLGGAPAHDARSGHGGSGADKTVAGGEAENTVGERLVNVRSDDHPFAVAQPQPVEAAEPSQPREPDEPDEFDETDEAGEPDDASPD